MGHIMAFGWKGRGYLALLTVLGAFAGFAALIVVAGGLDFFERAPWLWGVGLLLGAVVNWVAGCRLNRRPVDPLRGWKRGRLTYRGAHSRFLSLPMETWSAPALLAGLALVVLGLVWF